MARATVTTTAAAIASGVGETGQGDAAARSFAVLCPAATGTVLMMPGGLTSAPDMTNAARVDFSKALSVDYVCEPGVALWAKTSSGTVDLDILEGGQR